MVSGRCDGIRHAGLPDFRTTILIASNRFAGSPAFLTTAGSFHAHLMPSIADSAKASCRHGCTVKPTTSAVRRCCRETSALKEVVADLTLENRQLKKA
jgi:hypothetical protein